MGSGFSYCRYCPGWVPEEGGRKTEVRKGEFKIPVFIDSPLGLEIPKLYSALDEFWDKEAKELKAKGDHPIDFEHEESLQGLSGEFRRDCGNSVVVHTLSRLSSKYFPTGLLS